MNLEDYKNEAFRWYETAKDDFLAAKTLKQAGQYTEEFLQRMEFNL